MKIEKIQQNLSSKIKLLGRNAPEAEVMFVKITDCFKQPFIDHLNSQEHLENPEKEILAVVAALEYIEKITDQHLTEAETSNVTPLAVIDGKADIQPGCIIHRRNADIESIRAISQSAFLASEWFGMLESEKEGRFCSFATRLIDQNDPTLNPNRVNYHKRVSVADKQNITFYFDQDHPLMQKLIRLDYFEYARRVKESPEEIKEFYSDDEINMFEKLIYPLSIGGRDYHLSDNKTRHKDWIAIPGAIPSELVNGISIHTENESLMENLEEIAKMFPNATIFDQKGNVLRTAKILDEEIENISE